MMAYSIGNRIDYIADRMREVNFVTVTYTDANNHVWVFSATVQEMSPDELQAAGLSVTRHIRRYTITKDGTATKDGDTTTLANFLPEMGCNFTESSITMKVIPMSETSPTYKYTTHPRNSLQFMGEQVDG